MLQKILEADNDVLKFWEPNVPSNDERMKAELEKFKIPEIRDNQIP
jgi:hypothetical protein